MIKGYFISTWAKNLWKLMIELYEFFNHPPPSPKKFENTNYSGKKVNIWKIYFFKCIWARIIINNNFTNYLNYYFKEIFNRLTFYSFSLKKLNHVIYLL